MPITGVYFLPTASNVASLDTSTYQIVLTRLKSQYNINPLGRWTLDHRIFRGAPLEGIANENLSEDGSKGQASRHLQMLYISTRPKYSYVVTTTTIVPSQTRAGTPATSSSGGESAGEPAEVFSIPSGPQSENFIHLVVSRMGPLWMARQMLQVSNGQVFEVGDFRIRVGEVTQGHSGIQQVRGTICEIEWTSGNEDDTTIGEDIIKSFWTALDMRGAREYIGVSGTDEESGNIRQWCDALRLRL
ncbi:hypothetical protein MMC11_008699 [Xylographa trunciseda]|nr:hypothetical protein [Xylographa trunciseda]